MTTFSEKLFRNPTNEYRGAPFWAWNGKLEQEALVRQIDRFAEMGFGGFHMHARTGLDTPYLGEEFINCVKRCVQEAEKRGMLAYLYDEDRYPSGSGSGQLTRDPQYAARHMIMTDKKREDALPFAEATEQRKPYLLGMYDIDLSPDFTMCGYKKTDGKHTHRLFYAYSMPDNQSGWFNNSSYADVFNPEAIDRFVKFSYETYRQAVGEAFGKTVPAVFTDEPHIAFNTHDVPPRDNVMRLFWSDNMPALFEKIYGMQLTDILPELFFSAANSGASIWKYRFYAFAAELFAEAYSDKIGRWCQENNITLTGHFHSEDTLQGQTSTSVDLMRQYRAFGLPGIDMLFGRVEFTTAKQAQSVARQYGRRGIMSELYGVSNWNCDFRRYKLMGDWQAAMGVTLRVPHLAFYTMRGEAKRDYPASISYQSPWYRDFSYLETHYARLAVALTSGKPAVRVAVLHPIESYWLDLAPDVSSRLRAESLNTAFSNIAEWLVCGQLDFDYISEALLPTLWRDGKVGEMQYDVILVAGCETLRRSTLEMLTAFATHGEVLFVGDCPARIDGTLSDAAEQLYNASKHVLCECAALWDALAPYRDVEVYTQDIGLSIMEQSTRDGAFMKSGRIAYRYVYTMREDIDCNWVFIANAAETTEEAPPKTLTIRVRGVYTPTVYNTLTGATEQIAYCNEDGFTYLKKTMYCADSLLLRLDKRTAPYTLAETPEKAVRQTIPWHGTYALEEPNVLLLDMASYALDGEPLREKEEILRINNLLRTRLGLPLQGPRNQQPWTIAEKPPAHFVTLRYHVQSEIHAENVSLALENAAAAQIYLDGTQIENTPQGWYIDEAIDVLPLPNLAAGTHRIEVKMPFDARSNPEAMYLRGSFGVALRDDGAVLTALPKALAFSSVTTQGLPFYGGSIRYKMTAATQDGDMVVHCPAYKGAAVKVYLDGEPRGIIAFAPYTLTVPHLPAGQHTIELVLLGTRHNTLAPLHAIETTWYCLPLSYRTEGDAFTYDYQPDTYGILKRPYITIT